MPEAVVVAQYVNQPQAGKKHGSIKTPEGQYYGVPPAMLGLFKPDGTYKIFYESREFQGKTYHTVKTVSEVMAPPPPQPPLAQRVTQAYQTEKSLEIWINSMFQRAADHDKLDLWNEEACCEFGEIQKRVYRRLFLGDEPVTPRANSPAPNPGTNPHATGPAPGHSDMNDEIPFGPEFR